MRTIRRGDTTIYIYTRVSDAPRITLFVCTGLVLISPIDLSSRYFMSGALKYYMSIPHIYFHAIHFRSLTCVNNVKQMKNASTGRKYGERQAKPANYLFLQCSILLDVAWNVNAARHKNSTWKSSVRCQIAIGFRRRTRANARWFAPRGSLKHAHRISLIRLAINRWPNFVSAGRLRRTDPLTSDSL